MGAPILTKGCKNDSMMVMEGAFSFTMVLAMIQKWYKLFTTVLALVLALI